MGKQSNEYLPIGKIASLAGIHTSAIRYYEKEGLLEPAYKDENTGYRYYSEAQLGTLSLIVCCII